MTPSLRLTSADLDANRQLIAAAIAQHPLSLQLSDAAVHALAAITTSDAPVSTAAERAFLRQALAAIDAAEVEISRRAA